jgi:hypothetical protein
MNDKRYYSAAGNKGILAMQFIANLLKDPTLDMNEPIVDNYLFEVGYEMGWELDKTKEVIKWLELRKMLV